MCWIGKNNHRHVAEDDMTVLKIVYRTEKENEYIPYFRCYGPTITYKIGETAQAEIKSESRECDDNDEIEIEISEGLHCYNPAVALLEVSDYWPHFKDCTYLYCTGNMYIINLSNKNTSIIYNFVGYIAILEMTIPKGTAYYENDCGEIVTECLIPVKDVTAEHIQSHQ